MDDKGKGKVKGKGKAGSLGPDRRATGATSEHEPGLDEPEVPLPRSDPAPFTAVPVAEPLHLATLAEWEYAFSNPPVPIEGASRRLTSSFDRPTRR